MIEIRLVKSHEMKDAIDHSDNVFRNPKDVSMGKSFPQIFSSSIRHSFGAFEDDKMVAFMGLVPNVIRVGASQLHIYCLGSVFTVPEARGKGYASLLLKEVLDFLQNSGASLLLVSGGRSLYTNAGCTNFGQVRHYTITCDEASSYQQENSQIHFRLFQESDWVQFYQLTKRKKANYDGSMNDLAQAIECESYASVFKLNHKIYVAELEGQLIATVIIATQVDSISETEPFIVEWYGIARATVSLIQYIMRELSIPQINLHSPWHEIDIQQVLEETPFTSIQNEGTIKIVDYHKLWVQILPHLQEKDNNAANAVTLLQNDNNPEFANLSILGQMTSLSHQDFVDLLFDPNASIPSLEPHKSILDRLFPIEFPNTAGLYFV